MGTEARDWLAEHHGGVAIFEDSSPGRTVWAFVRVDPTLDHQDRNKLVHKKSEHVQDDLVEAVIRIEVKRIRERLAEIGVPEDRLVPLDFDVSKLGWRPDRGPNT